MKHRIYLDYAATTPIASEVLEAMNNCYKCDFGNAQSLHSFGRNANEQLENARAVVAKSINAKPKEIYFTSGGTEANNWAIFGLARANKDKGNHIIVSMIEHHSILDSVKQLEREGFRVSFIPVDKKGIIKYNQLVKLIDKDTILISVMTVNNEVGTIQPLKAIAELAKSYGILFHTDAVQALGLVDIDVKDIQVDAVSLSAHKIYGPKGIGALYVKDKTKIERLIFGGEQERLHRGGTVNVPAVVGFAKAVELTIKNKKSANLYIKKLKNYFLENLQKKLPFVTINGSLVQRIPSIINLSFEGVDAEAVMMLLDLEGIAVSTGSACTSGSTLPSHVLGAIYKNKVGVSGIRFTLSTNTTYDDIDYVVKTLTKIITDLKKLSPLKQKKIGG